MSECYYTRVTFHLIGPSKFLNSLKIMYSNFLGSLFIFAGEINLPGLYWENNTIIYFHMFQFYFRD